MKSLGELRESEWGTRVFRMSGRAQEELGTKTFCQSVMWHFNKQCGWIFAYQVNVSLSDDKFVWPAVCLPFLLRPNIHIYRHIIPFYRWGHWDSERAGPKGQCWMESQDWLTPKTKELGLKLLHNLIHLCSLIFAKGSYRYYLVLLVTLWNSVDLIINCLLGLGKLRFREVISTGILKGSTKDGSSLGCRIWIHILPDLLIWNLCSATTMIPWTLSQQCLLFSPKMAVIDNPWTMVIHVQFHFLALG